MLNMGSRREDLRASAVIRDEALRLFAEQGPDLVTVRQIAAAAGVSPGLVIHHFGSKERLREAVDAHVVGIFDAMLDEMGSGDWREGLGTSFPEGVMRRLPSGSPVPTYLRRLLLAGSPAAAQLFRRLYAVSRAWVDRATELGILSQSGDMTVRTAFLLINDLAVLLLREHLADVLGVDPLSPEGLVRWAEEIVAVYRDGIFASEVKP
jgi:TetR/AcrR family transcriptional regulator, regulator of cefoperazone and chloramphenicol sensitivity